MNAGPESRADSKDAEMSAGMAKWSLRAPSREVKRSGGELPEVQEQRSTGQEVRAADFTITPEG